MSPPTIGPSRITTSDVRRLLGDVDDATLTAVLALKPSLVDLEDAAACLAGNDAVLTERGHDASGIASRILELLAEDEDEPEK